MNATERNAIVRDQPANYLVVGIDVGQSNDQTAPVEARPVRQWTGGTHHTGMNHLGARVRIGTPPRPSGITTSA